MGGRRKSGREKHREREREEGREEIFGEERERNDINNRDTQYGSFVFNIWRVVSLGLKSQPKGFVR